MKYFILRISLEKNFITFIVVKAHFLYFCKNSENICNSSITDPNFTSIHNKIFSIWWRYCSSFDRLKINKQYIHKHTNLDEMIFQRKTINTVYFSCFDILKEGQYILKSCLIKLSNHKKKLEKGFVPYQQTFKSKSCCQTFKVMK